MRRFSRPLVVFAACSMATGLGTGCIAGHIVCPTGRDPSGAVRWTYRTGSQLVFTYIGPLVCRTRLQDVEVGSGGAVIFTEQFSSMGHLPPLPARWAVKLDSGWPAIARPIGSPLAQWHGEITPPISALEFDKRFGVCRYYRIPDSNYLLLVGPDHEKGLAGGFGDVVMCIDLGRVPPTSQPSDSDDASSAAP